MSAKALFASVGLIMFGIGIATVETNWVNITWLIGGSITTAIALSAD